jgi:hypothetical protein
MRERMEQMQSEMDRLIDMIQREARERRMGAEKQHALVRIESGPLTKIR